MLSPDLKKRLLDAAREEPAPPRQQWRLVQRLRIAVVFLLTLSDFWFFGGLRPGGTTGHRHIERPVLLIVATALGAAVVAGFSLWGAFGRGRSMLGRPRAWLVLIGLLTPISLFSWKVIASASVPEMMLVWPERIGLKCFGLSILFCIPPLVVISLMRRGSDPVHPISLGVAFGVAVGATGWFLVDLWCPVANVPHLLLGHALPLVILGAIGGMLGRFLLAPRRKRK